VWVYRWEDTVEADLLEEARELRAIYLDSRPRVRPSVEEQNKNMTLSDVQEVENWSLYRSRSIMYGMDIARRKNARKKVSL